MYSSGLPAKMSWAVSILASTSLLYADMAPTVDKMTTPKMMGMISMKLLLTNTGLVNFIIILSLPKLSLQNFAGYDCPVIPELFDFVSLVGGSSICAAKCLTNREGVKNDLEKQHPLMWIVLAGCAMCPWTGLVVGIMLKETRPPGRLGSTCISRGIFYHVHSCVSLSLLLFYWAKLVIPN